MTREEPFKASDRYLKYVLGILFAGYVLNFTDRQILAILLQSIKEEFLLSDTQLGMLGGLAFAVFYTTLGIPIARLADRHSRRTILSVSIALWSAMTALCGLATGFASLLLARIGVGVGEAGGSPPSHSLIADYFPPEKRATALGFYSMGISVGILIGLSIGGWVNQIYGWRMAFFVVGIPGLALAILVRFTLREPPRGHAEGRSTPADIPSLRETAKFLWRRRSFCHLALAAGFYSFAGYGSALWLPSFIERSYGLSKGEIGTYLGLIYGISGAAGTFLGGYFADRLSAKYGDQRWNAWLPAYAMMATLPFLVAVYLSSTATAALLLLIVPYFLNHMWLGPSYSMAQGIAGLRMRATAAAFFLFVNNMIGLGFGPWVVGIISDRLSGQFGVESLRYALLGVTVVMSFWAAIHLFLAARTLRSDLTRAEELSSN